jgi:WhiB family transcriptional regulator, redox-sensing transcriptional regulator
VPSVLPILLHCYGLCYTLLIHYAVRPRHLTEGTTDMTAIALCELPLGACTRNPERWTTAADDEAKSICQACPRRWLCAREACELPGVEGLWAGVVIPESGRGRTFALRQLRSLAERNGYQVRGRKVALVSA